MIDSSEALQRMRRGVVKCIPEQLAALYSRARTAQRLGWKESGRLEAARRAPSGTLFRFDVPGLRHPVFVRSRSTDPDTFEACLIRQYHGRCVPEHPVRFIIDAGANAGYSAVFFLERYADALVVALEPDSENLAIAHRNLDPYGARSFLLDKAIWPTSTRLRLQRSHRHDSTKVVETDGAWDCQSIDPMSLLQLFKQERISIFKCDIEGAEERLFSEDCDVWLARTDMLAIEIHGRRAHQIVYDAMHRHGFASRVDHELHFFIRKPAIG